MKPAEVDNPLEVFRRLLTYTWRYWLVMVISVLGFAMYAAIQPLIAEMLNVITRVLENPTPGMVLLISIAPTALVLAQGVTLLVGKYCISWVGQRIVYDLRNEIFHHILRLPEREYQSRSSGRILSKVTYDAQQVTSAGTEAVTVVFREGLTVVGLLGYMIFRNWQLTLLLMLVAPILAYVVNYMSRRFRKISRRIQGNMGSITQYLGEAIDGHQPVKIFSAQDQEEARFDRASNSFRQQQLKLVASKIASMVSVQLVVAVGIGVVAWLYINMMGDEIRIGEFLAFVAAAGMLQKPLKALTAVNVKIQKGITGAASLFELMDTPGEPDTGTRSIDRCRGELEFRDVSFGYLPGHPVIEHLSFHAQPNEVVALVGRSGAGKSTAVALVPRFHDPDEGEILLDGVPLEEYRLSDLRRQIAMVTQKVVLFNDTIRYNIAYGELRDAPVEDVIRAAKDAYAWDFIQNLEKGLDTPVGQDGVQLSGGQRQRIAIARALLKDSRVLILDEATSALDNESEYYIQQALERVMVGRTTLVIAHRLSTVEKADRILVLEQGRVIESGTHSELIRNNGVYAQQYRMNFEDM